MRQRIVKHQKLRNSKGGYKNYTDWREASGKEEPMEAEPDNLPGIDPYEGEELKAIVAVLNEGGLDILTPKQREIFQLVVVEGKSLGEAAQILQLSKPAIQQRLNLAAKKLRIICYTKLG